MSEQHTLIKCAKCDQIVRARYAIKGMCPACAEKRIEELEQKFDIANEQRDRVEGLARRLAKLAGARMRALIRLRTICEKILKRDTLAGSRSARGEWIEF